MSDINIRSVIVIKNRDFLIGYIAGTMDTKKQYGIIRPTNEFNNDIAVEDRQPTLMPDAIFDIHCT